MDGRHDVVVVGGGVAGRTAASFTARHDLETLVVDAGDSILRRNAHLENFPGFPLGVDARRLLDLQREQAERAGAAWLEGEVETVEQRDGSGFAVETADGQRFVTDYVVAATKNEVSYLRGVEGVGFVDRGKTFVDVDEGGRTSVEGLYAAGRLAEKPHQAVVCAGHGAEVAVALLEDDDRPFYHDWVTPEGYFTGRDRDLPPGCEEIPLEEHEARSERAREALRDRLAEPHPEEPQQHPSVADDS